MPEVTEIKVTVGGTINLGNYENVRREITLTAKVAAHESAEGAHKEINDIATYLLAKDVALLVKDAIDGEWLGRLNKDADYIRNYIASRRAFDYLKTLSPAMAEALIEEYIAKYAAPEKPAEPAAEKSADAEIVAGEIGYTPDNDDYNDDYNDDDNDDYDLDEDDDLEDDFDDDDDF